MSGVRSWLESLGRAQHGEAFEENALDVAQPSHSGRSGGPIVARITGKAGRVRARLPG